MNPSHPQLQMTKYLMGLKDAQRAQMGVKK